VLPAVLFTLLAAASPSAADLRTLQADRNVGLAALEESDLAEATRRFADVRRLAPSDPLGWANGAVAAMRARDLETAGKLLTEAVRLSGGDPRVLALEGARRELAGDPDGAAETFERAAAASPKDVASLWAAARIRSGGGAEEKRKAMADLDRALAQAPANLFLLVRLLELSRATGDTAAAASAHARLATLVAGDARLDRALAEAKTAAEAGDAKAADLKYRIVENLLKATPRYQQSRRDVEPGIVGLPLEDWSEPLASAMRARAGEPVPVRYSARPDAGLGDLEGAVSIRAAGKTGRDLAFAAPSGLRVATAVPGTYRLNAPIPGSEASRDLAVADVTNSGELELLTPEALWSPVAGRAWKKSTLGSGDREAGAVVPFDVDADGDLDVYVSSRAGDRLLRNNLDGTFANVTEAAGLPKGIASRGAVAADLDRDGDVDLLLFASNGGFLLYDNLRGGRLAPRESGLPKRGAVASASAGDLDGDGRLDLLFAADGTASTASNRGDGTFAEPRPLGPAGAVRLVDYDNDGFLDALLLRGDGASSLRRNDGAGRLGETAVGALPAASAAEAVDFDGDGDLDLVFLGPKGGALLYVNEGGNANGWIDVVLEGLPTGSAKVNRFGFGSDVELKAQELYVYRVAWQPVTRLGLGARRRADVLRIVWTNGIPQNDLDPKVRTVLREVQQLKGSCPFLYAFDGAHWRFVTDVLGRAPAGLLYDGVHQAPADTREWMVVPAELLQPREGRLELDFTEELWETVYFDLAELWAVDRPVGVALVPNEKMVPPPFPEKKLFTVANPRAPKAIDGKGRDRTAEISDEDGRFLGGFAHTRYQGIVEPHDLVLELPEARGARSVMLYLTGWIQYADTSINVSLSQRGDLAVAGPSGPTLEVPDNASGGRGGWKTAIAPMGYPAGKTKTMPVDLSAVLDRTDPRVRIRTNLAIYWDRIVYTVDDPPVSTRLTAAPLVSAELSFRGFSRMTREHAEAPHVFVHDDVSTEPRWADMAGRYTRFGDVRALLTAADDRYVVMKGGDSVRLVFDASKLPPLPAGWARDWLFVSDGWEKDADKNTVASQTVEPLPFHGMDDARYGQLEFPDSPEHREYVREYLTREGGPDEFRDALKESRGSRVEGPE
jgi:tetratricopeptide (TPR) repeat protein